MKHKSLVNTLKRHGLKVEPWENSYRVETSKSIGSWYIQDDRAVCVSTLSRSVIDQHDPLNDCNMKSYHRTIKGFIQSLGI